MKKFNSTVTSNVKTFTNRIVNNIVKQNLKRIAEPVAEWNLLEDLNNDYISRINKMLNTNMTKEEFLDLLIIYKDEKTNATRYKFKYENILPEDDENPETEPLFSEEEVEAIEKVVNEESVDMQF